MSLLVHTSRLAQLQIHPLVVDHFYSARNAVQSPIVGVKCSKTKQTDEKESNISPAASRCYETSMAPTGWKHNLNIKITYQNSLSHFFFLSLSKHICRQTTCLIRNPIMDHIFHWKFPHFSILCPAASTREQFSLKPPLVD